MDVIYESPPTEFPQASAPKKHLYQSDQHQLTLHTEKPMNDTAPTLHFRIDHNQTPAQAYVLLEGAAGNEQKIIQMSELLQQAPALLSGGHATPLAQAINLFSQGDAYEVVTDPTAFFDAIAQHLSTRYSQDEITFENLAVTSIGLDSASQVTAPTLDGTKLHFLAKYKHSYDLASVTVDLAQKTTLSEEDYQDYPALEAVETIQEDYSSSSKSN